MKRIKKILLALFVVVVLIVIIGAAYLQYTKPSYEGEYQLQNLAKETTVYYDDYGVPHIYADNQKDAMTTLGYVHAQDRLWQMELMRRIAPGRLSEIFGGAALKSGGMYSTKPMQT